jgi:hypothetical protein
MTPSTNLTYKLIRTDLWREFLTGKIASLVLRIATKSPDKVLHKEQIFNIVDASIQGTTPSLISCREKYLKAAALQIELSQVLREINALTQSDEVQLKTVRFCPPKTTIPNGAVTSNRLATPIPNGNGKRTLPQAERQTVRSKDWKGKGFNEPNLKTDPFGFLGKENLSYFATKTCNTLWIKGWDRKRMDQLRKSGGCLVCGQQGHIMKDCRYKQRLFLAERFCFRCQI